MKIVDFSETIAACDLKVGRFSQLIKFMTVCESMPFLELCPTSFTFEKN